MSNQNRYLKSSSYKFIQDSGQTIFLEHGIGQSEEENDDDYFYSRQAAEVIYNILGEKVSNCSREEITESILSTLRKNEGHILQRLKYNQRSYHQTTPAVPNINIIYLNPSFSINNINIPTNNPFQSPLLIPQPNPYIYTTTIPYQMSTPMPIPSQIAIPSPMPISMQSPVFNQPLLDLAQPLQKKHKSKKDKKKRKNPKKSKKNEKNTNQTNSVKCDDGIFQYLIEKFKTNPATTGYLKIEGNPHDPAQIENLTNIIDLNWRGKTSYVSKDEVNSYVKIEFTKSLVKIKKYRIVVGNRDGKAYFKSWTFSGVSSDGKTVVFDEVIDTQEIYEKHTTVTRDVKCNKLIRSIKLTMKGESTWNIFPNRMIMRNIEIYGSIIDQE